MDIFNGEIMIYIVQRTHNAEYEEYTDIILVTMDKEKADLICEKFQDIFPNDEIWTSGWEDGEMPYSYEVELRSYDD